MVQLTDSTLCSRFVFPRFCGFVLYSMPHGTFSLYRLDCQLVVLFCFVLFCFGLFCFVLFCVALFCFAVFFCFVSFCFVAFCFVFAPCRVDLQQTTCTAISSSMNTLCPISFAICVCIKVLTSRFQRRHDNCAQMGKLWSNPVLNGIYLNQFFAHCYWEVNVERCIPRPQGLPNELIPK